MSPLGTNYFDGLISISVLPAGQNNHNKTHQKISPTRYATDILIWWISLKIWGGSRFHSLFIVTSLNALQLVELKLCERLITYEINDRSQKVFRSWDFIPQKILFYSVCSSQIWHPWRGFGTYPTHQFSAKSPKSVSNLVGCIFCRACLFCVFYLMMARQACLLSPAAHGFAVYQFFFQILGVQRGHKNGRCWQMDRDCKRV